jgi:hypothetical protein
MKNEVLNAIAIICQSTKLADEFYKGFPNTTLEVVELSFEQGLLSKEVINRLLKIVPPCYKIGETVFLKGGTGEFEVDETPLIELYDMTEEIRSGDSYTFYTSTLKYFPFATAKEHIEVTNFLRGIL